MHRRSLTVSALLMVLMIISAGVVHASGGDDDRGAHTKKHTTKSATVEEHPRHRKGTGRSR